MKKISIIIPVYNIEGYISKCIDSVLNQEINDIEVILINDGSTDKSLNILKFYKNKYPDIIKVIDKKNGGQGSARNEGLKIASGKYISFVDGDDWIDQGTYLTAYEIAEKNDLDILFWNIRWVYEDGKIKQQPIFSEVIDKNCDAAYILADPSPCNKLIKREIFNKNKLSFPLDCIYEDFALIPSLIKYSKKILYTDKLSYNYRQRVNSTMLPKNYNSKFLDIIKAFNHLNESLKNSKYLDELEYLAIFQLGYLHSFKFLNYNKFKEINKCYSYLNKNFPEWQKNKYYLIKPVYFRIYTSLLNKKHFWLAKLLFIIRNYLRR